MKEGRAKISGRYDQKVEPKSMAINPGYAGQLGVALGDKVMEKPTSTGYRGERMRQGEGYTAPKDEGVTIHHGGTNRRHG